MAQLDKNFKPTEPGSSMNSKHKKLKTTLRHIIMKLLKTNAKEMILKAAREKEKDTFHTEEQR